MPCCAPLLDELAVLVELHHPGIVPVWPRFMAVGDEDVAVGRHQHRIGLVESGGVVAGCAGRAQGHQHLAVLVELDHVIALLRRGIDMAVGDPEMIVAVDRRCRAGTGSGPRRTT